MNKKIINTKLKLITVLFKPLLSDKNNNLIDDKFYCVSNKLYNGTDRLVEKYLNNTYKLTKDDLIYINTIINKLINILSLDESLITKEYVASKLFIYKYNKEKYPFDASENWINAYKKLIKYIKNGK